MSGLYFRMAHSLFLCLCALALPVVAACSSDDQPPIQPTPQQSIEPAALQPTRSASADPPSQSTRPQRPAARETRSAAELLLVEAGAFERNGFWEDALASRARALSAPEGLTAEVRLSAELDQVRLLLKLKRPLDAESRLRMLADSTDTWPATASQRHALLAARSAILLSEPTTALEALERYLGLGGPAAAAVRWEMAQLLESVGRLDEARSTAERAIIDPLLPTGARRSAAWLVATLLDNAGEVERALRRYQEVIDSAPWPGHTDIPAATSRIAALSDKLGQTETADTARRRLITEFPTHSEALVALEQLRSSGEDVDPLAEGLVRYRHGQPAAARAAFILVLSDPPNAAHAAAAEYYIAAINEDLGEFDGAILGYRAAIGRDPSHPLGANARWWIAGLLEARGGSAEELLRELYMLHPDSEFAPAAARRYAVYALERGEWAEAAQRFRGAANAGADYWPLVERQQLLLWSGIAYRAAGDPVNADTVWERTILLDPAGWYALRAATLTGADSPSLDAALQVDPWLTERFGEPREHTPAPGAWRAALQLRLGGFDDAADAQLRHWIALHEGDGHALWIIARLLTEAGETSAAATAASALLRAAEAEWWEAPAAITRILYPTPWPELVSRVEQTDRLDPLLLYSLIRRESLYDADARGAAGEIGLTQVIEGTSGDIARGLGETHDHERLARPETAIRYGAWYLAAQLAAFDSEPAVALAAYNAGPGNAARWQEQAAPLNAALPPDAAVDAFIATLDFSSTRAYLRNVIESLAAYRALAAAEASGAQ